VLGTAAVIRPAGGAAPLAWMSRGSLHRFRRFPTRVVATPSICGIETLVGAPEAGPEPGSPGSASKEFLL
jgi:hypothetical protein